MKLFNPFKRLSKKLLILPPVAVGVAVVAFAARSKEPPEQSGPVEIVSVQEVIVASGGRVQPVVTGYGVAQPARVWRAVARVDGDVVAVHPNLDAGRLVHAGETLLTIDPTDYELTVGRLVSEAATIRAEVAEVERQRENDRATLEIESRSLELAKEELARDKRLEQRGAVSRSKTDDAERSVLRQAQVVQSLRNSLALVPAKLDRLSASLDAAGQELAQAKRDLNRTVITAPFDARVAAVSIEVGQYVGPNEPLFELHGTETCEVEVRVPFDDVGRLLPADGDESRDPAASLRGLPAQATLQSGGWSQTWPGEIVRIRELVDRQTRTLGLVVAIPTTSGGPLLEGSFLEVAISGHAREAEVVLPSIAVRNGTAFLVDDESRLRRRSVEVGVRLGDRVVVRSGVRPGDRVVVGDPASRAEGTLIRPIDVDDRRPDTVVAANATAGAAPSISSQPSNFTESESPQ